MIAYITRDPQGAIASSCTAAENLEAIATDHPEYLAFLAKSLLPPPIDAVAAAEKHIESYFSASRLLQLKVWWDTYPHDVTPRLAATYLWIDTITRSAIADGATTFAPPPHTFTEIAAEIITL